MPGPLPNPQRRRRNAPTISTTALPLGGRPGKAPVFPSWYSPGKEGLAWWRWAWKQPQSAAWPAGMEDIVARRACLVDDLVTLEAMPLDVCEMLQIPRQQAVELLEAMVRRLSALATGRLNVMKEMRELDDRLGLSPKAMAALRWGVAEDEVSERREEKTATRRRLSAVDPSAVAGA